MDPVTGFTISLAALGLGAGAVLAYFSEERRIKRALRRMKTTPIGSIRGPGLIKVEGTVVALETLTAPLSGRPCTYFEVVEEKVGDNSWRRLIHEVEERDFLLEDATGRARVELVLAHAAVTQDRHWTSGFLRDATPTIEEFLQRHGQSSKGSLFNRELRFREGVLEPGERASVIGAAELELDPTRAASGTHYRDTPTRPVLREHETAGLLLSDDPSTFDVESQAVSRDSLKGV
jgi:hypothetical protein